MFNVNDIKKDFPFIVKNPHIVYLDNAATTQKPRCVVDAISDLYENYNANPHSYDYSLAVLSEKAYEGARKKVAKFINANSNEIVFNSGDTAGLNFLASSLSKKLKEGDQILLSQAEHASNVLPWFKVKEEKQIDIGYIPLDDEGRIQLDAVEKAITPNTKIISLAQVTNVLGYKVDIKGICEIAHKHNIIVIVDGAQSIPHMKVDVKDLDCDFLVFSGHKLYGPTGIGVIYGKFDILDTLDPINMGGGMNGRFDMCGNYTLIKTPNRFESGTVNLEGAVGLGAAIDYLESIGMDNIEKYEKQLHDYAISKMEKIDGVKIYNKNSDTGIITFNFKDIFAQDLATHLASYNVCVRSGQHCAKILMDFLKADATVRASFGIYNTFEDVDKFVDALSKGDEYLDVYFK